MQKLIPDDVLYRLSAFVLDKFGLSFPEKRWNDLERKTASFCNEMGCKDLISCVKRILASNLTHSEYEIFVSHLTVGETYFFREEKVFTALQEKILSELIHQRNRAKNKCIRIWSAGCCTGEEPYSIAILLKMLIRDLKKWNITILGTDINPRFLQKASEGIYRDWSFRNTPSWLKDGYFEKTSAEQCRIIPEVRRMVTFGVLNLAEDIYPSITNGTNAMDLILCRNVLMYFASETAGKVIGRFEKSLVRNGWLIFSSSETFPDFLSRFERHTNSGAILYRKGNSKEESADILNVEEQSQLTEPHTFSIPFEPIEKIPFRKIETVGTTESTEAVPETPVEMENDTNPRIEPFDLQERAISCCSQGKYQEAIDLLLNAIRSGSNEYGLCPMLARAYSYIADFPKALEWCEKAVQYDKLNPSLYYLCGTIHQEQGNIDQAIAFMKKALYVDPEFVLAHFALASLHRRTKKNLEAKKEFTITRNLLLKLQPESILPESEGLTAGRMLEVVNVVASMEKTL